MLKKVNIALGIIAVIGALFIGGVLLWTHLSPPDNSSITEQIGR